NELVKQTRATSSTAPPNRSKFQTIALLSFINPLLCRCSNQVLSDPGQQTLARSHRTGLNSCARCYSSRSGLRRLIATDVPSETLVLSAVFESRSVAFCHPHHKRPHHS